MDEDFPITLQEESSNPKKGKTADWLTCMKSDCADAFSRDSNSVKEARAHYFATHSWDWARGNTEDLSNIFKELAQEAGLLGEVYFRNTMVMEGTGAFTASQLHFSVSTQGLRFLRAVSAKESAKEMGLKGIHDPEALRHFFGYTYCLWCGKSGQNEGTIVNYLRTTHYKLGLICDQCFGCPTTTSDTLSRQIRALPPGGVLNLTLH